jgi:hypothetical protein
MFALIAVALMGVLAAVAPRHGVDSRPGFTPKTHR